MTNSNSDYLKQIEHLTKQLEKLWIDFMMGNHVEVQTTIKGYMGQEVSSQNNSQAGS